MTGALAGASGCLSRSPVPLAVPLAGAIGLGYLIGALVGAMPYFWPVGFSQRLWRYPGALDRSLGRSPVPLAGALVGAYGRRLGHLAGHAVLLAGAFSQRPWRCCGWCPAPLASVFVQNFGRCLGQLVGAKPLAGAVWSAWPYMIQYVPIVYGPLWG